MMTIIQKVQSNQICLTLQEKTTSNLPKNYLFRFISEQNRVEYKCYLTDISISPSRFNLFNFIESTNLTLKLGDYILKVYQMPNGGSVDYTLGNLCEITKCKVITTPTSTSAYNAIITSQIYD